MISKEEFVKIINKLKEARDLQVEEYMLLSKYSDVLDGEYRLSYNFARGNSCRPTFKDDEFTENRTHRKRARMVAIWN